MSSTNKKPDALDELLGTSAASKPKKAAAPAAPAAAPKKENLKPFSAPISEENALRLKQHRYWKPGTPKVHDILNAALKMYFDSKPEFDKPIPDEE